LAGLWFLVLAPLSAGQTDTADESPDTLEPVVVVATKSDRPIRDVAANVTVVTSEDLDASLTSSLNDVFRYVPGIDAEGGGTRFGTEGVIIRGIGGNRVAMELDGVPLSQQFATGNFSNATRDFIDVGFVERIEVLHGPASALYGSAALGGVVASFTPDPPAMTAGDNGAGFRLSQGYRGDDNSHHTFGAAAYQGERSGLLGMLSLRDGEEADAEAASGPDDDQDYDRKSALLKLVHDDRWGNNFRTSFYRHESDVDTNIRSVLGNGRFRSTTRLEGSDHDDLDLFTAAYAFGPVGALFDAGVVRAWYETVNVDQDTLDERAAADRPVRIDRNFRFSQDTRGFELNLQRRIEWGAVEHRLITGLEWTGADISESRNGSELGLDDGVLTDVVLGEAFPVRDFPESDTDEYGIFVQDDMDLGRVSVIAALRYDRYELDPQPDAIYVEDNPDTTAVDISQDEFSPKLGVIGHLTPAVDVYLQYAHGFRSPSFEDANIGLDIPLFNIRAIPNPDLQPERSDGLEAGLRWRGRSARADLNFFYTRYEEFIETKVPLGPDPDSGRLLFQSQNISEAQIYGAELNSSLSLDRLVPGLRLRAAAFWARGDNDDSDQPLNSVGPGQAVLGLNWSTPDGRGDVTLQSTFTQRYSRLDESRGELFEAPGYAVFDLYASRRMGQRWLVRLGIENLLERTYWRWADVRGLAPDDPVIDLLSQPGRSVSMNLRLEF